MLGGKSIWAKIFGWPFYLSQNLIKPHISRHRQSKSGHLLVVNVHSWVGLFAHLEWFLEICVHCERHGLTPCFSSTSPQYVDADKGPDWFAYFFENRQIEPEDVERIKSGLVPICRIDGIRQLGLPENYDPQLNLELASKLVRKYIGLKNEIVEQVDDFCERRFGDGFVLGIHFRGTDKGAEAPLVSRAAYKESIMRFLEQHGAVDALFVSSDEQRFIEYIEGEFGGRLSVIYHDDRERSSVDSNVAVHRRKTGDRFRKAEEAVMNCLLLSRCNSLIKNASFLSAWSKLFNPDLPVILLNSPHERQLWFPDRELLRQT